jgi:hypothetical protein
VRVPAARRIHLIAIGAIVAVGCWHQAPARDTALENRTPEPAGSRWRMSPSGVGPLTGASVANLEELRRALPGTRVEVNDLGPTSGIVFDVFEGTERVFYVVPDDVTGESGSDEHDYAATIFAVFAVSSRVTVEGRTWRVGQPFEDASSIDRCECWGGGEVTACFQIGTHLRVIFEAACADAAKMGARAMIGQKIDRIMWKRVLEPDGLLD